MINRLLVKYIPYIVAILSVGSVYFQLSEDGIGMILYYSLWNNVLMALAPFFLKKYPYLSFTSAAITITVYTVYETYLVIFGGMDYPWWEYRNFVGHYLCPVLIFLWAYLNKYKGKLSFKITLVPMTLYIIFLFINIMFIKLIAPLTDDTFPYFFMEYKKYGSLPSIALVIALYVFLRIYFILFRNKFTQ